MQIREMKEKDNQRMEQIIKRSLESFNLNIPGTAYFDPQLSSLSQYYQQQPNAKYWVVVNDQDEVIGGVGIAPFGQKKRSASCKSSIFHPTLKEKVCRKN